MVNCILLISLCFTILVQAVRRLITVESIERKKLPIYITVGVIGLCINIVALLVLGGDLSHGHSHESKHTHDCEAPHSAEVKQTKKKNYGCRLQGENDSLIAAIVF